MHITVYLFKGRDTATKRKLTENILAKVREMIPVPIASLSVDARDTDQDIYVKIQD
jgi:5-carboxymethyl-2-hydroxymuconate isomerase